MRQQLPATLTRDDSQALKGLAVILMIVHHLLINGFYDDLESHVLIDEYALTFKVRLRVLGKICIGIFMFVTAYGYSLSKHRDWGYSFSHIRDLLARYWVLLLAFIGIGVLVGNLPQLRMVLLNMFGLASTYSCANWYVYFYIYAMLILPAIVRLIDLYRVKTLVLSVIICGIASLLLRSDNLWIGAVRQCLFYTPVLVVGCYVARCGLPFIKHQFSKLELLLMLAVLLIAGCYSRDIYGFCTYTVLVPALAFTLTMLFRYQGSQTIKTALAHLGELSLYMWFIHTVFFSFMTRSLFQQSRLWPDSILLIFLLVFFSSLALSFLLSRVERAIVKKKG